MNTLWEKEKLLVTSNFSFFHHSAFYSFGELSVIFIKFRKGDLLVTSNFSFSHNVFYPFGELSDFIIKFRVIVWKLSQFEKVQNLSFGKGLRLAFFKRRTHIQIAVNFLNSKILNQYSELFLFSSHVIYYTIRLLEHKN